MINLYSGINDGYTGFHFTAWLGDIKRVKNFLRQKDFDFDKQNRDKITPFALSVHRNHIEVFQILLECGVNVNNSDCEGDTPLHHAVSNGNLEMVETLIEHEADVCATNDHQMTPVWIAAYKNYSEILKLLLYNFADPTVYSAGTNRAIEFVPVHRKPVSPLYIALEWNSTECVDVLIQAGYEIHKESWLLEGDYPVEMLNPCVDCYMYDYYDEYDLVFQKAERKKDCKVKENIALLNDLLSRPPTLLSLCRTFIRERAGRRVLTCVSELGLPRQLEGYLTLSDFKTKFKK